MDDSAKIIKNLIFEKTVKAGKRVYFFDVRENKRGSYYITITESKRRFNADTGKTFFEKHKLFLYKADFEKFTDGLQEAIDFIKSKQEVNEIRPTDDQEKNQLDSQDTKDIATNEDAEYNDKSE